MERHAQLICPICHDFFENVVETPCCSSGYCIKCLDNSLRATNGTCPNCRASLDIFKCVPNKMVQRMVDDLPTECLYCSASLTRSIFEEHVVKCDKKPRTSDVNDVCDVHKKPLINFCKQDKQSICTDCSLVGIHRHHNTIMKEKPTTPQYAASSRETQVQMMTYASIICSDSGIPITVENIQNLLHSAGCIVDDDAMIDMFVNHANKFDQWMVGGFGGEAVTPGSEIVNDFDEKAAAQDYEILKEKYLNEQFNFEGLRIKAVPICPYLLAGVKNHVYVLLEIRVGKKKEGTTDIRPPYAVSLVLDRSGSMGGSKLNKAKDAIKGVIDNLEEKDTLHLIQYDQDASVVFRDGTCQQKLELKSMVDSVYAGGSTNISQGLNLGFHLLNDQRDSCDIRRIFLFSDGCANAGLTSKEGLCDLVDKHYQADVKTSSFGIGDDFDERVMRGISESGHGYYFFINESEKIPSILEKAFRGLSRTVASNVVLKMKGNKGRQIKKLNGNDDLFKGISLGDMREKDLKQILVQVEIEEGDSLDPLEILEFELSYDRMDECIPTGPQRGKLHMLTTRNEDDVKNLEDEVLVYLKINECGEMDKTIVKLLENNKMDEALSIKREIVNILTGIVQKDKVGFAKVLLLRAKNRLHDLEQLRAPKVYGSARSKESVKKEIEKDAGQQSDEDMGFGLFD